MCVHGFSSLCCAGLRSLASLLLLVRYDVVLLHVLHQLFFTGGLEAADVAAEEQHAVLHACWRKHAAAPRRLFLLAQNDVWPV